MGGSGKRIGKRVVSMVVVEDLIAEPQVMRLCAMTCDGVTELEAVSQAYTAIAKDFPNGKIEVILTVLINETVAENQIAKPLLIKLGDTYINGYGNPVTIMRVSYLYARYFVGSDNQRYDRYGWHENARSPEYKRNLIRESV